MTRRFSVKSSLSCRFLAVFRCTQRDSSSQRFPLTTSARCPSFAKEFRTADFIHRCGGMLHDVELVIDDTAVARPLFDALSVRLPHVHTCRPDRTPLKGT